MTKPQENGLPGMTGPGTSGGVAHRVNSDFSRDQFIASVHALYARHGEVTFTWTTGRVRTSRQNAALHVYCRLLAEALNDAGLDMRRVLKPGVDIPWTQATVKDHLWRPIQQLVKGEDSTRLVATGDYGRIYDTLNRRLGEKFGVGVAWPVKQPGNAPEASQEAV